MDVELLWWLLLAVYIIMIELTGQLPVEELLAAVKAFKRNGDRITEMLRGQRITEAMVLVKQEEASAGHIEELLRRCE